MKKETQKFKYEIDLQVAVMVYLSKNYPNVIAHGNVMDGFKLDTMGGKVKLNLAKGTKGFPDLGVYYPAHGYCGLFLELKRPGDNIYKKDGSPVSDHVANQLQVLQRLREAGYYCDIMNDFDKIKELFNFYLGEPKKGFTADEVVECDSF